MIDFYDVSVYQNPETVANLVRLNGDKVLAVKASEGASGRDRKAVAHVNATKKNVEVYLFYHFMRCDKNATKIENEVDNFLGAVQSIARQTGIEKCIYALDFERSDNIHKYSDCNNPAHRLALRNAIYEIENKTGVAPYVYACESEYKSLLRHNVIIPWAWVARYGGENPPARCGIWQYTNTGGKIDRNHYLSTLESLKKKEVKIYGRDNL